MPASMISAPVGSSLNVSGSSIAIVAGGPRPGSTPITVPSTTPITHIHRLFAVSATWKPWSRPAKMSMRLEQKPVGEREIEGHFEERVEPRRSGDRHDERRAVALPAHHLHDEPGKERERDDEAEERHERDRARRRDPAGERPRYVLPAHFGLRRGLHHGPDDGQQRKNDH